MMRRTMLLLPLLFALAACASPSATPTSSPEPTATVSKREFLLLEPFTLKVGTSLALKGAGLTVSFISVPSDERCGACTASGNAEAVLQLTVAGQPAKEITLQVFPIARTYAEALPYTVHMLNLEPTRHYPRDVIDASDYEVSLVVEKPTITCRPQSDDPDGYLLKLCTFIQIRHIDTWPADPTKYRIKRIEERDENGHRIVWVFLNCCELGDIGMIDKVSGEVLGFRQGAH